MCRRRRIYFLQGGCGKTHVFPSAQLSFPTCLGLGQPFCFPTAASLETKVSSKYWCKAKPSKPSHSRILHQHQHHPQLRATLACTHHRDCETTQALCAPCNFATSFALKKVCSPGQSVIMSERVSLKVVLVFWERCWAMWSGRLIICENWTLERVNCWQDLTGIMPAFIRWLIKGCHRHQGGVEPVFGVRDRGLGTELHSSKTVS